MNSYPEDLKKWPQQTSTILWQILDKRYILLDSIQSVKIVLEILFLDNWTRVNNKLQGNLSRIIKKNKTVSYGG